MKVAQIWEGEADDTRSRDALLTLRAKVAIVPDFPAAAVHFFPAKFKQFLQLSPLFPAIIAESQCGKGTTARESSAFSGKDFT